VENIKQLKSFEGKDIWYPPAVQWINKPAVIFSLINLTVFGIGIPYFALALVGIFNILIYKKRQLLIIIFWVLAFFLYQSVQFVKAMRYFVFIYPFLAIFAGIGIVSLFEWIAKQFKNKEILNAFYLILAIILLIWPIMFSSIYFNKNSRVEASEWIYKNLPSGSYILSESWDDSLPLSVANNYGKQFSGEQLLVFDPDNPEKWKKINMSLEKADYYILSSNRGWGSIMTVPEKYPQMSQFYKDLLVDKLSYKKIKEFKPYYYKFFQLPNSWVDESFTVYDHPEVLIFKNDRLFFAK